MTELEQSIRDFRSAAQMRAAISMDDDPEKAGRAFELQNTFGVPAQAIHTDLESYEDTFKGQLSNHIIANNPHLQEYINSHPLHATLSNDDWGQMDVVSAAANRLGRMVQPAKEAWGDRPLGLPLSDEDLIRYGDKAWFKAIYATAQLGAVPIDVMFRGTSAALATAASFAGYQYGILTDNEEAGRNLGEDLTNLAFDPGVQAFLGTHIPEIQHAQAAFKAVRPWTAAGVEPPAGVHPVLDDLKVERAKSDAEALYDALRDAQASKTRERNPQAFSDFIRQHTQAKIGISAEAVRRVYGEAEPALEDGKLGWIPDIVQQLRTAEAYGGDVEVSLADWLAKVEPEIARELRDDVRVRADGLTINEGKELSEANAIRAAREEQESERILGAAIRTPTGEIFYGTTHSSAWAIAADKGVDVSKLAPGDVDGFLTSSGRYVSREEAAEIASAKGQVEKPSERLESSQMKPGYFDRSVAENVVEQPIDSIRRSAALDPIFEHPALPKTDFGEGFSATVIPTELMNAHEAAIAERVSKIIDELAPGVQKIFTRDLKHITGNVKGIYGPQTEAYRPYIAVSLDYLHPEATAMHEVIHHLRQGYFTDAEWRGLAKHALEAGWIQRYNIRDLYREAKPWLQTEEAIAHAFPEWAMGEITLPEPIQRAFERIRDLLDQMKAAIQDYLGYRVSVEDLFQKAARGEIGRREPREAPKGGFGPIRMAAEGEPEAALFEKANAIGMTVKQYRRYQELIAQRDAEDAEAAADKHARDVAKRQTKEWKEASARMRDEVEPQVRSRPDIAADHFLRENVLFGQKIKGRTRLDEDSLTAEQKAALPADYYGRNGVHPDDVASAFGYKSGDAMIEHVAKLESDRKAAGLGPQGYTTKLINDQVEAQMRREHGDPEAALLDELKDQAISSTQMELLHEEVVALGMKAGGELSISKDDLKRWAKQEFDNTPNAKHNTDKYLAAAGKAGRAAELALLSDKPAEAFKAKQQQYLSMLLANGAKKLDKAQVQFAKLSKKYSKREVESTDQDYTNFIHQIFGKVGIPVRRSVQDLAEHIQRSGHDNLTKFMQTKQSDGLPLDIADFLLDDSFKKPLDQLTAGEFAGLHSTVKMMDKVGRGEKKQLLSGDKRDTQEIVENDISPLLQRFGEKPFSFKSEGMVMAALRSFYSSVISTETLLNHWDENNPRGPLNRFVVRPMTEAANYGATLDRKYGKQLGKLGDLKDADRKVPNSQIVNPETGEPIPLTRRDMMGIIHNWGNESNISKFLRGWKIIEKGDDPAVAQIKRQNFERWLYANTTPEMWQRGQAMGKIFGNIFKEISGVYYRLTGLQPEAVELNRFTNTHGSFDGWYHPMIYSTRFEGDRPPGAILSERGLLSPNFKSAMPSNPHAHSRTGYAAPVELNSDMIPIRMKQMLHDVAFREAVVDVNKIFKNTRFRSDVARYYSERARDELRTWLSDIVNGANIHDQVAADGQRISEFLRQNTISTYVGLNIGTVLKHGPTAAVFSSKEVGPLSFARELTGLLAKDPRTGEQNYQLAMSKSEELQRRDRNWQEAIMGVTKKIEGKATLRERVMQFASKPVAISDKISAVPTWLAQYKKTLRETGEEGQAVFEADRAVRRAHGSTAITNLPRIARGGGIHAWLTSLYGFFGTRLQRMAELGWDVNDAWKLGREGELKKAAAKMPGIAAGYVTYVVVPTLIESLVIGARLSPWAIGAGGIATSVIYARDVYHALEEGGDVNVGLISSALHDVLKVGKDIAKGKRFFTKEHAGEIVDDTTTLAGIAFGVIPKAVGKAAKYGIGLAQGREKPPPNIYQAAKGIRYGTTQQQRRR